MMVCVKWVQAAFQLTLDSPLVGSLSRGTKEQMDRDECLPPIVSGVSPAAFAEWRRLCGCSSPVLEITKRSLVSLQKVKTSSSPGIILCQIFRAMVSLW